MFNGKKGRDHGKMTYGPHGWGKKTTFCMRLPLVPFFVYWWLAHPTTEGLEKILNTLGIVDALMLTLAVGMAGTFDYAELRAADDRFMSAIDPTLTDAAGYASYFHTSWWMTISSGQETIPPLPVSIPDGYQVSMSERFLQAIMLSTFFYTISLLTVVMLLVFMSMADLDKFPEGEAADVDERKRMEKRLAKAEAELGEWYKYNHCALSSAVIGFLVGTVIFFRSMWFLIMIKAPDYYVLLYGEANTSSIYAWPALLGFVIGGLMGVMGLLGCWGNYAVHALNKYGTPQGIRHVVFFGPATKPDGEVIHDHEAGGSAKFGSSAKIAPEPERASLQGATKVQIGASDDAKLAATLVALGEQMLALGKRLEAQQTIPASF